MGPVRGPGKLCVGGDWASARPSGCTGWLVRDLVCHLIIDAQDVLITLVTPAETEPTRNAVTYWDVAAAPPTGDDPLDALLVGTGRRAPADAQKAELGELAAKLPLVLLVVDRRTHARTSPAGRTMICPTGVSAGQIAVAVGFEPAGRGRRCSGASTRHIRVGPCPD
ncbi:MAG TPA: maleylpyruvate isomerase N-terminal domain-containing protein [Pseudonocardia sp.]|uniref:maleylpyruvate isomerase N-terminal domain-containing protein n=1 Tax=Pseudonocardia sp. TaxID=60912 RepID=UPI002CBC33BB|nr:maleylpyruvate isomerase N-terminal domain-containing protein [Pseudonocardia sp.]HTF53549.1 maleylpyruvate isomerase N-terminal domain-containing protein [Pseudonocardia sp.]